MRDATSTQSRNAIPRAKCMRKEMLFSKFLELHASRAALGRPSCRFLSFILLALCLRLFRRANLKDVSQKSFIAAKILKIID